jgi:hypothetical protein
VSIRFACVSWQNASLVYGETLRLCMTKRLKRLSISATGVFVRTLDTFFYNRSAATSRARETQQFLPASHVIRMRERFARFPALEKLLHVRLLSGNRARLSILKGILKGNTPYTSVSPYTSEAFRHTQAHTQAKCIDSVDGKKWPPHQCV